MKRIFVGLKISERNQSHLKKTVTSLQKSPDLQNARFYEKEEMHITLHFVGEMSLENIALLAHHLQDIPRPHLNLEIQGLDTFDNIHETKILWAKVVLTPELTRFQKVIQEKIEALIDLDPKLKRETFVPHITILRSKVFFNSERYIKDFTDLKLEDSISSFSIFESRTGETPKYIPIHTF